MRINDPLQQFDEGLQVLQKDRLAEAAAVEIFLGIRDIPGCFAALGIQVFWIAVLWILQEVLWRKSVYKLTVLGG